MNYRVESLLSARLFLFPQHADGRIYFLSNLSGHLSLYAMNYGGSMPEPLLPPHIALQNPELIGGYSYCVFPKIKKILVMIDHDGDENYQPTLIPLSGGFPEPTFDNYFANHRVHLALCDKARNIAYFFAERRDAPIQETYRANVKTGELTKLGESPWGLYPAAHNKGHSQALIGEGYTVGDSVLYQFKGDEHNLIYGKRLEERAAGEEVPLNGIASAEFAPGGKGAVLTSAVFDDTYGLGYINFAKPGELMPVQVKGTVHRGKGEMERIGHLVDDRYLVQYNIDGCSWVYEGLFNEEKLEMNFKHVLVGKKPLDNGKLEHLDYDEDADLFTVTFSTATSPTQIYTVEGRSRTKIVLHTNEKILGIPHHHLSRGEDASFISHDGLRLSARLYLPGAALGFTGPRPVVYYIHGGPQGQERPDFAWFSMPLIQFLTLRGFAVFVPNVRGSTGYGLAYTKHVDRDWGGQDRLDHVHAMTKVLSNDPRLDVKRAAVVGRSYGGYMTLTLAGRHPDLWAASCDMFGPYDLLTFSERIPETWKPYFKISLGDPDKPEEKAFLIERSPNTHLQNMSAPMLVFQGRNDPRVVAAESEDLVRELRSQGKQIELIIFENEGHDVLKYENRVTCYNAIVDFFAKHLNP
ncbi:MAG TPA: prolyl oligopeptidase family serine peptidase [Anaerolineales bacterium]|nr:prolyl oligopeptidase family serine peptidase [Anaerolineales bacterium]